MSDSLEKFLEDFYKNKDQKKQDEIIYDAEKAEKLENVSQQQKTQKQSQPEEQPQPTGQDVGKSELFYHIVLDCDFPKRNKLGNDDFKGKYTGHIRDYIKNSGRIPILYNYDDAKKVASKLVSWVMDKGTSKGKRVPIFGAIILGFRPSSNVTIRNINTDISQHGAKDYSLIFSKSIPSVLKNPKSPFENSPEVDIIAYNIDGVKRGLISNQGIKDSSLVSASYGYMTDMPLNIGLCLLNIAHDKFEEDDIRLLRQILSKNGQVHMLSSYVKEEIVKPSEEEINTETSDVFLSETKTDKNTDFHQLTGGDYKNLYKLEKQKYLKLSKLAKERGLF